MNDTIANLLDYFSKQPKIEFKCYSKIKYTRYSKDKFRCYLYNPEPYYDFCGIKNKNTKDLLQNYRARGQNSMDPDDIKLYGPILKSDTRRQFETLLAKALLIHLAQDKELSMLLNNIYEDALAVYYSAKSPLNEYVKQSNLKKMKMAGFITEIIYTNINDPAACWDNPTAGKHIASQFHDAYRQYACDQYGFTPEANRTIRIALRLLMITQYIGWVIDDICKLISKNPERKASLLQDRTFARLYYNHSLYCHDPRFKNRGRVDRDQADTKSHWRGISQPFNESSANNVPGLLKTTFPAWSPANTSAPGSEPEHYYIEPGPDKTPDGWLINAIKRHQPFVNSISGLCFMFSSQIEILLKIKMGETSYFKLEQFLAAIIVYYAGGHSFYESLKGFKVGRVSRKLDYLKWRRFCHEAIPDRVIDNTIKELEKLCK